MTKLNDDQLQLENINRAKIQWELVVDSLPQLVIAIDENARITRANKTIETWGIGKVNEVNGLYISDFLKIFNDNMSKDITDFLGNFNNETHQDNDDPDWAYIWQQIKNKDTFIKKTKKTHAGRTYNYTLRKIENYNINKDQCFAVLIIDDITKLQHIEKSLKFQAQDLEKKVIQRTKELKQLNLQLEHELQNKEETNIKLKESHDYHRELLQVIFTTQENERKRIACELHDSIGQSLAATKFKIEGLLLNNKNIFNKDDNNQFNNIVDTIKNLIDETRHISMNLRPATLDDLGAIATLKWFCREFENTYSKIKIDLSLNIDEHDISDDKKTVIYRIVQESMNNIAKHGDATTIQLELNRSNSNLNLNISDNGRGFNISSLTKKLNKSDQPSICGFGLNSMRERAESINGTFKIESKPGKGTSILVSWKI
ncbi:MAG: hypothetical protein DIZ80_02140 [endosymbiont of Galathealinum brachiosum]|uniref:histidine kinase n=1 Tax=endosymbiont of Galathealinum brachiosum TaxID=2200906 RepID=A0A370DK08_9GAMM|nr:MAG: hypothetical protein DIZ80_02140 [endosymbiont of Galathealinum brachiosum]